MARFATLPLIAALLGVAAPAAGFDLLYATARLGSTSHDTEYGRFNRQFVDGDDETWSLGAGLRFGRYIAFQAEYQDLGSGPGVGSPCSDADEVCITVIVPVEADARALTLSALPHLPINRRFSLYAKLGVVFWESEVDEVSFDLPRRRIDDFDDEDVLYGVGFRADLPGPFGAFAEYERLGDAFDTVGIGATFGF